MQIVRTRTTSGVKTPKEGTMKSSTRKRKADNAEMVAAVTAALGVPSVATYHPDKGRYRFGAGWVLEDVPAEKIAGFVSLVANGIAVQLGSGEPIRDVGTLLAFVRSAIAPPTI